MFLGPVTTTLMFDGNVAFTGAHAFGLLAILLLLGAPRGRRLVFVWASLLAALTFNGTAVPAVVVAVVFAGLRYDWRAGARVLSAPLLAYVWWTVEHSAGPTVDAFDSPQRFLQMSEFVWSGLTEVASSVTVARALGPVLLVVILMAPYVFPSPTGLRQWAVAGQVGALSSVALIAATPRYALGSGIVASDRYVYAVACHLLPCAAILVATAARSLRVTRAVAAVAAVVVVGMLGMRGIEQQVTYSGGATPYAMDFKREVYGLLEASDAGQRVLSPYRQGWAATEFDAGLMINPEIRKNLPARRASLAGRVDAESEFMTAVSTESLGLSAPVGVTEVTGVLRESGVSGCRWLDVQFGEGSFDLRTGPGGSQVSIDGPAKQLRTQVVRGATDSRVVRTWPTDSRPVFVGTSAEDATLRVTVDSVGRYRICDA
jgi:hypothetical protein